MDEKTWGLKSKKTYKALIGSNKDYKQTDHHIQHADPNIFAKNSLFEINVRKVIKNKDPVHKTALLPINQGRVLYSQFNILPY